MQGPCQSCCTIHTLGTFFITQGDEVILKDSSLHSHQWDAFTFLMTFRNQEYTADQLISKIYQEAEGIDPQFFLDSQLKQASDLITCNGDHPYVSFENGRYQWNTHSTISIDTDQFERLIYEGYKYTELNPERALKSLKKALDLYQGDYLEGCTQMWVYAIRNHYRSLYADAVKLMLELLKSFDLFNDMLDVTKNALQANKFDEKFHCYYMETLCLMGQSKEAMAHYENLSESLYNSFHMGPSSKIQSLYKQLKNQTFNPTHNGFNPGDKLAFYCGAHEFKMICELELRRSSRTNTSVGIGVVSLKNHDTLKTDCKIQCMEKVKMHLEHTLRHSDCFTQWDERSFYILFPYSSTETTNYVLDRLMQHFPYDVEFEMYSTPIQQIL